MLFIKDDIIGRGAELFNDVHEDFHNIDLIKMKFGFKGRDSRGENRGLYCSVSILQMRRQHRTTLKFKEQEIINICLKYLLFLIIIWWGSLTIGLLL